MRFVIVQSSPEREQAINLDHVARYVITRASSEASPNGARVDLHSAGGRVEVFFEDINVARQWCATQFGHANGIPGSRN